MDLETLEEIRQVKYRYLRCVDRKLWDEIGDVFTADATVDYGTQVFGKPLAMTGRDEIVAFFRSNMGPGIISVHSAGQPEITVDGDTATASTDYLFVRPTAEGVTLVATGRYRDRLVRHGSRWQFRERAISLLGPPVGDVDG